jgi:hypothetical protein
VPHAGGSLDVLPVEPPSLVPVVVTTSPVLVDAPPLDTSPLPLVLSPDDDPALVDPLVDVSPPPLRPSGPSGVSEQAARIKSTKADRGVSLMADMLAHAAAPYHPAMPSTWAVDPTTLDLVRDRQGFVLVDGIEAIEQDLRLYLGLRQGEIPTRQDLGIPWGPLLESGASPAIVSQYIGERGVLTRPGIVAQQTTVEVDGRTATITYEAQASLADQRRRAALRGAITILV